MWRKITVTSLVWVALASGGSAASHLGNFHTLTCQGKFEKGESIREVVFPSNPSRGFGLFVAGLEPSSFHDKDLLNILKEGMATGSYHIDKVVTKTGERAMVHFGSQAPCEMGAIIVGAFVHADDPASLHYLLSPLFIG